MHSGRGATRIGNDSIPVSLLAPSWLTPRLRDAFEAAGLAFEIQERYTETVGDPDSDDPTLVQDRFTFPGVADDDTYGVEREHAATLVQRIVDSVPETHGSGC